MKDWGAGEEEIAAFEASVEEDRVEEERTIKIEPENGDAVRLFLRMRTQWRTVNRIVPTKGGGFVSIIITTGLDLSALDAVARWISVSPSAETLESLHAIEDETLRIFAERSERALSRLR